MAHKEEFQAELAKIPTDILELKVRAVNLTAIMSVRLKGDEYGETMTVALNEGLVSQMNMLYKSICRKSWSEVVDARYSKKFRRWTVTVPSRSYFLMDVILGGSGDGTVERAFNDAGIMLYE